MDEEIRRLYDCVAFTGRLYHMDGPGGWISMALYKQFEDSKIHHVSLSVACHVFVLSVFNHNTHYTQSFFPRLLPPYPYPPNPYPLPVLFSPPFGIGSPYPLPPLIPPPMPNRLPPFILSLAYNLSLLGSSTPRKYATQIAALAPALKRQYKSVDL